MDYELNFEDESFQGYQGERRGYVGEYEFEDSKQNALDLNNPSVVRALQGALSRATGVKLPKLDRIGPQAAGLLRTVQKQHRIKPNGVVGPNTVKAIKRHLAGLAQSETDFEGQPSERECEMKCAVLYANCLTGSAGPGECQAEKGNCFDKCRPTPKSPPRPMPTLSFGWTGPAVKFLQEKLNRWLSKNPGVKLPKLQVTGNFHWMTERAVRAVQQVHKLKVDGIVGKETWPVLLSQ
jgi:hypothetical protein